MLLHTYGHAAISTPASHQHKQLLARADHARRLLPVAHAKGKGKEQKNQGLYFDYEPVDKKAAEEVPVEKERLQDEFAWVQNARRNVQRHLGQEPPPKRKQKGTGRRPMRSADSRGSGSPAPPLQARPARHAPLPQQPPASTTSSASAPPFLTPPGLQSRQPNRPAHPSTPPASPAVQPPTSPSAGAGPITPEQPSTAQGSTGGLQPAGSASESSQAKAQRLEEAAKRAGTVSVSDESRRERISRLISKPSSQTSVSPTSGSGTPVSSTGDKLSERKQRLLSRMQAPPTSQQQSPTDGAGSATKISAAGAAAAAAAGAAAAASGVAGGGGGGGGGGGAESEAAGAEADTAPSKLPALPGVEGLELPPLPKLPPLPELPTEGLNEEELQAREVLKTLLSLDPRTMAEGQQQGGSLSEVYAREKEAQEDFEAWVQQLRANKAAAQAGQEPEEQQDVVMRSPGAVHAAEDENDEEDSSQQFLVELESTEAGAARMLESQGQGLGSFNSLLSRLQSSEDFGASEADFSKADGPALSEEQVIAQLAATDPELHALLTSGPPLDKDEDIDELTRALDSLSRLGLGGEQPAEAGAEARGEVDQQGTDFEEEEVSDAELLEAARYDPDLAALLRGEKVGGLDLDRALDRELGGDEDGDMDLDGLDDDADGDQEGDMDGDVGFADLFDALEEDPDISAVDKAQAMHEIQGMFNSAGRLGKGDRISKRYLLDGAFGSSSKGVTTTGASPQDGSGDGQSVPLLPRPSPRPQQ